MTVDLHRRLGKAGFPEASLSHKNDIKELNNILKEINYIALKTPSSHLKSHANAKCN